MKDKKKKENPEMMFIPGGILFGMGLGFLFDNLVAYMFMGLGAGFVLAAIISLMKRR
jgi:hypothetical protein